MFTSENSNLTWRRSGYSGQGGNCVEVGTGLTATTAVRDSKDKAGPALHFPVHKWTAFLSTLRSDQDKT